MSSAMTASTSPAASSASERACHAASHGARELGVTNRLDPRQSIEGGTKYLARMLKMFKGNIPLALAGYNAGPGNVLKYRGVPPFRETQAYVRLITANYYRVN
jgi:soluble lytic murein transglycosylase-like protein